MESNLAQALQEFTNETNDPKFVTFIAALVIEPSRSTVSHITNMLLLDQRSDLDDQSEAPEKQLTKTEQRKHIEGTLKSSGVYEHTSMTQSGSDPSGKTSKKQGLESDQDLETEMGLVKNVTDRDLAAVKRNQTLVSKLEKDYNQNSQSEDNYIITQLFIPQINQYLNLNK